MMTDQALQQIVNGHETRITVLEGQDKNRGRQLDEIDKKIDKIINLAFLILLSICAGTLSLLGKIVFDFIGKAYLGK